MTQRTSAPWTPEEDRIIKTNWHLTPTQLHMLLPHRTVHSITQRKHRRVQPKLWTRAAIKKAYDRWGGERAYKR